MTDIHDIKPILLVGAQHRWLCWLAGALSLSAALLLIGWLSRRRGRPPPDPALPPPSPAAEAHAQLDRLAADTTMAGKHFYFQLSSILRYYIARRFAIPAAGMSVEELLPRVARLPIAPGLVQELETFCRAAEPVKFAGHAANPGRMAQDLAFARDFVARTTQKT